MAEGELSGDNKVGQLLRKLYYDPIFGLLSLSKFKLKVKQKYPQITHREIEDFVKKQELQQINSKSTFQGFFKIVAPPKHFQIDVFFMSSHKQANKGISMFLICIDILSRKMWIFPLKNKTQESLLEGIEKLNKEVGLMGLEGDDEFSSSKIKKYCEEHSITLLTDVASDDHIDKGNKLGIVDTACRTIKTSIRNYMATHDTTKFINILPALVDNYNDTPHSSLKNKTPDYLWDDRKLQLKYYDKLSRHNKDLTDDIDLSVGDDVRKRVDKGRFDKETAKFSSEIYIIYAKVGNKYVIVSEDGVIQPRKYKYFELKAVDPLNVEGNSRGLKEIEKDKETNRKINRTRKATGTNYEEAQEAIAKKDEPREKRIKKKVTKLDL